MTFSRKKKKKERENGREVAEEKSKMQAGWPFQFLCSGNESNGQFLRV